MILCQCACANLVPKANFNLINRTDLFICLHIMFQISFQNSKGQKSYCKCLGVRSELLLSIVYSVAVKFLGISTVRKSNASTSSLHCEPL